MAARADKHVISIHASACINPIEMPTGWHANFAMIYARREGVSPAQAGETRLPMRANMEQGKVVPKPCTACALSQLPYGCHDCTRFPQPGPSESPPTAGYAHSAATPIRYPFLQTAKRLSRLASQKQYPYGPIAAACFSALASRNALT